MASKNQAVFGIYASDVQAERAVDQLIAAGFPNSDISVLLADTKSTRDFAHHKDTKAPEGTAVGVTTGGVVGGTLGVLAGIGALAIPVSVPSSRQVPLWPALRGSVLAGPSAASWVHSLEWESPNTRRSDTRAELKTAAPSCRSIAIPAMKSAARRTF